MSAESLDPGSIPPGASDPVAATQPPSWARVELLVAVGISLWIIYLHGLFLFHAGPLWCDEAGTIGYASMPTLADLWHHLHYDNFPPLFIMIVRYWPLAGLSGDFGYRILGFLVGLWTLGVIWFSARACGARVPLLALALYGANPLAIRVGDSMRSHGLGIALTMLTLALIWKFVENPLPRNLFWATLVAVLGVQFLYQNAVFILAFTLAAWSVALARRQWKTAAQTLLIGAVAALSLLPFISVIRAGEGWRGIIRYAVHFADIWSNLSGAMNPTIGPGRWMKGELLLAVLAVGMGLLPVLPIRKTARFFAWNRFYCANALLAAVVLYLCFLCILNTQMFARYFLILLAPAALVLDAIFAGASLSWARTGLALLLVLHSAGPGSRMVRLRQSNVDWIAAALRQNARPDDVIVVSVYEQAVSLQRYYGTNGLITLPPLEPFRIYREDLLQKQIAANDSLGPLFKNIEQVLRSGHALWVAGELVYPSPDVPPLFYPAYPGESQTPRNRFGTFWRYQLGQFVKSHAIERERWPIPALEGVGINPDENLPLMRFHGWKDE